MRIISLLTLRRINEGKGWVGSILSINVEVVYTNEIIPFAVFNI